MIITWGNGYIITFDATLRERHGIAADVTDHPVQRGAAPSDHIRALPLTIDVEAVVTNGPIVLPADHVDGVTQVDVKIEAEGQPLADIAQRHGGGLAPGFVRLPARQGRARTLSGPLGRTKAVYSTLSALRDLGELVTVEGHFGVFDNLAITSAIVTKDGPTNQATFQLSFKQVTVAEVTTAAVPAISTGHKTGVRAAPKADEEPTPENHDSFLFRVFQ